MRTTTSNTPFNVAPITFKHTGVIIFVIIIIVHTLITGCYIGTPFTIGNLTFNSLACSIVQRISIYAL